MLGDSGSGEMGSGCGPSCRLEGQGLQQGFTEPRTEEHPNAAEDEPDSKVRASYCNTCTKLFAWFRGCGSCVAKTIESPWVLFFLPRRSGFELIALLAGRDWGILIHFGQAVGSSYHFAVPLFSVGVLQELM